MTAGELCSADVVIARPEWPVTEAALRMAEYDVGDVVVVEHRRDRGTRCPVGLLTDRDLVVGVLAKDPEHWRDATIGSVMTRDILTAHVREDVADVIAGMTRKGVRRVPVVNDDGSLEGILTYDDIVQWLSDQMTSIATVARAARSSVLGSR